MLVKFIHMRIEEKFKDFRKGFRSFDKNYDGNLNFKEFMQGLENIGIKLVYDDYKRVFSFVDFDGKGDIDFNKFCLLNTDKNSNHLRSRGQGGKPPLRPVQVPKNKSMHEFTADVTA